MAPFDKSQTSWYWSSVVNMALICIISEIKRDTGRNSKITTFAILSALEVPVRRGSPSEYCHKVWYGKTRMVCLPDGEKKSAGMITRFDATHERDEHDRETDSARRHRPRLSIALSCKNSPQNLQRHADGQQRTGL